MTERVCVLGLGYIGLPTAAILAARGMTVHGVEVNPDVVESINSGKAHFAEPDLDMLVQAGVQTGRLTAYAEPASADVFIICVPTPLTADHSPDMGYVHHATDAICPYLQEGNLVILESTSPPGTTDWIAERIAERTGLRPPSVMVGHAPERLLPGRILHEVVDNDRIVGGIDEQSTERMAEFYSVFARGAIYKTNAKTAETTKLVENAYRDVNIAFANELSRLTEGLEVDVWDVIEMANRHPRVNILAPGPGVGGHCIPVDPWFLVATDRGNTSLIQSARRINLDKPQWVVDRVSQLADRFKSPRIACLGLAYKPDVEDLRESASVEVIEGLRSRVDGEILIVEPNIDSHPVFELVDLDTALRQADIVVFLVAHSPFKRIPPQLLEQRVLVDTCGILRALGRGLSVTARR